MSYCNNYGDVFKKYSISKNVAAEGPSKNVAAELAQVIQHTGIMMTKNLTLPHILWRQYHMMVGTQAIRSIFL